MLVKGHCSFVGYILFVVFAEPVGEIAGDLLHPLPHLITGDSRAAAARIVGVGKEESLIGRPTEKGGLTQAGVAADHGTGFVEAGFALGVVQHALCRPRPQGDLAGVGGASLPVGVEDTRQAAREVAVVTRHVAVAEGQDGKAVVGDLLGGHVAVGDVGAEVDVDEDSHFYYETIKGEFGDKIRKVTYENPEEEEGFGFTLTKNLFTKYIKLPLQE